MNLGTPLTCVNAAYSQFGGGLSPCGLGHLMGLSQVGASPGLGGKMRLGIMRLGPILRSLPGPTARAMCARGAAVWRGHSRPPLASLRTYPEGHRKLNDSCNDFGYPIPGQPPVRRLVSYVRIVIIMVVVVAASELGADPITMIGWGTLAWLVLAQLSDRPWGGPALVVGSAR